MPTLILKMLNRLLETQNFPEKWKRSGVVLIPKGMKGTQSEMTYRPICLLDTIGKLYEMLISERLAKELEEKKYLAERQYGFRKGRSTVQAVLAVTEDPKLTKSKWCC